MNCLVNKNGELLEILQTDRNPIGNEFKVPLSNYYEVLNKYRFPRAIWDFKLKLWVGVGEQIILPTVALSELDKLKADVDYLMLINGGE